jgi:hypothetical protein
MGNQASQGSGSDAEAAKNLQHFDHTFKAELHTTNGPVITFVFGACAGARRKILVVCTGSSMNIIEQIGVASKTQADLDYFKVRTSSFIFPPRYAKS